MGALLVPARDLTAGTWIAASNRALGARFDTVEQDVKQLGVIQRAFEVARTYALLADGRRTERTPNCRAACLLLVCAIL